jgi:preprotein translocase subunit SecG
MTLFVEIVYVFITVVMILVVLLQAGRGGGLGTALGGGASQGVFGGGGGADFLAKLTQGLAAGFMICAVYLAYASAHTGSSRLQAESDETQLEFFDDDEAVDYERVGEGTVLPLREPGGGAVVPTPPPAQPQGEVGAAADAEAMGALMEALEQVEQDEQVEQVEQVPAETPTGSQQAEASTPPAEGEAPAEGGEVDPVE